MPGASRRNAWGIVAAAALILGVVWRLDPVASPPIYDGVCVADPYRVLGHTPPPSSASMTYPAASFPTAEVLTSETPAQAQVLMMAGTFGSPTAPVTVSITPAQPPAQPPAGLRLDGNDYRIIAVSGGKQLQPGPQDPVTVVLRGTGASAALTMYADSGSGWKALRTFNLGCGFTFEAVSPSLGDFALLYRPGGSGGGSAGQGGGLPVGVIVGVLAGLIIGATIGLARFSAGRRR